MPKDEWDPRAMTNVRDIAGLCFIYQIFHTYCLYTLVKRYHHKEKYISMKPPSVGTIIHRISLFGYVLYSAFSVCQLKNKKNIAK